MAPLLINLVLNGNLVMRKIDKITIKKHDVFGNFPINIVLFLLVFKTIHIAL